MADIAKVITIIGSSPESFAKAADAAVQEAAKTVRGISGADVVSMSAVVENDRKVVQGARLECFDTQVGFDRDMSCHIIIIYQDLI